MVLALCFTSCSSDETEVAAPVLTDTPMTISTKVIELSSRAGYDDIADLQTSNFGFFLSTDGSVETESSYKKYNTENLKFSYENAVWTSESQLLWKSSNNKVSYYAYAPYDETMTLNNGKTGTTAAPTAYPFSVSTDQSSTETDNVKASDFIFASATGVTQNDGTNSTDDGINLEFAHKMSKIRVVLTKGTEISSFPSITSVTLSQANTKSTINLTSGKPTAVKISTYSNPAKDITLRNVSSENTDGNTMFECIIVPQSLLLTISINDSEGNNYQFVGSSAETFNSGYAYTLKLAVGKDKVTLDSVTINTWKPNSTDDDGNQTSDDKLTTK